MIKYNNHHLKCVVYERLSTGISQSKLFDSDPILDCGNHLGLVPPGHTDRVIRDAKYSNHTVPYQYDDYCEFFQHFVGTAKCTLLCNAVARSFSLSKPLPLTCQHLTSNPSYSDCHKCINRNFIRCTIFSCLVVVIYQTFCGTIVA